MHLQIERGREMDMHSPRGFYDRWRTFGRFLASTKSDRADCSQKRIRASSSVVTFGSYTEKWSHRLALTLARSAYLNVERERKKGFMNDWFLISSTVHSWAKFASEDIANETFTNFVLEVKTTHIAAILQNGGSSTRCAYRSENMRAISFANLKPIFSFLLAVECRRCDHFGTDCRFF